MCEYIKTRDQHVRVFSSRGATMQQYDFACIRESRIVGIRDGNKDGGDSLGGGQQSTSTAVVLTSVVSARAVG